MNHSLRGSETDQIIRPEHDGVILKKVQPRVLIMIYGLNLGQGSEVVSPGLGGWISSSVTLNLISEWSGEQA